MRNFAPLALAAGLALSAFGLSAAPASAMPAVGAQNALSSLAGEGGNLTEARVVCGPRGCFRTGPRFYGRGYYRGGPRYRRGPYGRRFRRGY